MQPKANKEKGETTMNPVKQKASGFLLIGESEIVYKMPSITNNHQSDSKGLLV
jgi:hypothetical protein